MSYFTNFILLFSPGSGFWLLEFNVVFHLFWFCMLGVLVMWYFWWMIMVFCGSAISGSRLPRELSFQLLTPKSLHDADKLLLEAWLILIFAIGQFFHPTCNCKWDLWWHLVGLSNLQSFPVSEREGGFWVGQNALQLYNQELPAMSFAANTGKESNFLRNCISNGCVTALLVLIPCRVL